MGFDRNGLHKYRNENLDSGQHGYTERKLDFLPTKGANHRNKKAA